MMHAANLALRFVLELATLGGFASLGWSMASGYMRIFSVLALLMLVGGVWTIFAVPADPSRSGAAPVPISGRLRLLIELAILFGGAFALHATGHGWLGLTLAVLVIVHYLLWTDRIVWLLRK